MSIPLELLIDRGSNIYGLTNAMIHRAHQLTLTGEEDSPETDGKIVSSAIDQVLTKKVEYRFEES